MAQLIVRSSKPNRPIANFVLRRRVTTVGSDPGHDVFVEGSGAGLAFTLLGEGSGTAIVPGTATVLLNGSALRRQVKLQSCDRLEWAGHTAVFMDTVVSDGSSAGGSDSGVKALALLNNISVSLHGSTQGVEAGLKQALDGLIELSGAEEGYLLSDVGTQEWKLVATSHSESQDESQRELGVTRRELLSHTILKEVLEKRSPVCVESIIGHPYAEAASVIAARIFSVACLPLIIGDQVVGAAFLFTRSPGRSIRQQELGTLGLLATQAAMILGLSARLRRAEQENIHLKAAQGRAGAPASGLVYDHADPKAPMGQLEAKLGALAATALNVLIQGETGTGKELVAREIHRRSPRATGPFVAINCAAIPPTLLESELFGYEKGAFTGAVRSRDGKFAQAHGGTILLDEIGDLSAELQAKLLRVLQERVVEPLGSNHPRPIDVRVISATHRNLESMVREGAFRQDLFFRLNGAGLKIPALRARRQDIPLLARHFLKAQGLNRDFSPEAIAFLEAHPWPGNVRELESVVVRAGHLASGARIEPHDLEVSQIALPEAEQALFWDEYETLDEAQRAFTQGFLKRALTRSEGNRTQAARRLGISERTLYRLLASDEAGRLS